MEGRLSAKLEKASEASKEAAHQAKLNSESLELLEQRVDANKNCLMEALKMSEARILAQVQSKIQEMVKDQVKGMVDDQLHAAGFDQDLTAGDLSVRRSAVLSDSVTPSSYTAAVTSAPGRPQPLQTKQDKQENNFHLARRSLRLWPIPGGKKESLQEFLVDKLRLGRPFVQEDLGLVTLSKPREPRNKNKDKYIVTFESKQVRDTVKANASNLANFRETAGMRLHVPDHLQRDFQALMNLSFDLKKKHPDLKRNIKFNEEDLGLYMDFKLAEDREWKRVKPAQASRVVKSRRKQTQDLGEEELMGLLGEGDSE